MRLALCTVLMVTIGWSAPATAEMAPADIAKKVETFYKDRPDIRATFVQKVKKPGRRRVLEKSGTVLFKRPGQMRWDYVKPEQVHYISDGKVLWSYQPEDSLVTKLNVQSSELYHQSRYLFGQGDLTNDFTLSKGKKAPKGAFPLVLKPKKSSSTFEKLTLMVDEETGEIRSTVLIDPYGNESTITFEKTQYKEVPAKHFIFTPPAGAKVRNLDKK